MPITIYIWLLIVAVCATAAICLMAGHAIGYHKAEKLWKTRYIKLKFRVGSTYGRTNNGN